MKHPKIALVLVLAVFFGVYGFFQYNNIQRAEAEKRFVSSLGVPVVEGNISVDGLGQRRVDVNQTVFLSQARYSLSVQNITALKIPRWTASPVYHDFRSGYWLRPCYYDPANETINTVLMNTWLYCGDFTGGWG